jgi:DNA replication protein DnaC
MNTNKLLQHLTIPRVHWDARLAEIPGTCPHLPSVTDWVENVATRVNQPFGLLLLGEPSMGKSAIAAICLKAAASRGIFGYWVNHRQLPAQRINNQPFDENQTIWERACSVPLLIIDEVQLIREAYTEQILEELVRIRIDERLCTILTSNHSPDDFKTKWPTLFAALDEAVKIVVVRGHNFRKEIAKEIKELK